LFCFVTVTPRERGKKKQNKREGGREVEKKMDRREILLLLS